MVQAFGKYNDIWVSQNTFYKKDTRKIEDIYELRHAFSDIDCYKVGMTPYQVYEILKADYFGRLIPVPSLVIFSGRGLQLIWQITPESLYSLPVWQAVQDYIYSVLKEFGADPQATDAARILRVAGTYNQKNHAVVEVQYLSNYVHNLTEIIEGYIPLEEEQPAKTALKPCRATTKANKIKHMLNPYSLTFNRMLDIQTLIELRATTVIPDAHKQWGRETLLFLYRYYACLTAKTQRRLLKRLSNLIISSADHSQFERS